MLKLTVPQFPSDLLARSRQEALLVWKRTVEPNPRIDDPDERRHARLVNGLLVLTLMIVLLTTVIQIVFTPVQAVTTSVTVWGTLLGATVVIFVYVLNRIVRSFESVVLIGVSVGFVTILAIALSSPPPHLEITYLIYMPLVGIAVFKLRTITILSLLILVTVVIFSITMPDMTPDIRKTLLILVTVALAFIVFAAHHRDQLEQDRQQLAIERTRSDLLAEMITNLSHDFRTPLSIINTNAYLLGRIADPQSRQLRIDQISQQTARLNRLLEDILLLSRLEEGVSESVHILNIDQILDNAVATLSPSLRLKHLNFSIERSPEVVRVIGNANYLERAFTNVLKNALDFTPQGGNVRLRIEKKDTCVIIEVIDSGAGIPLDDLHRIFDPFYRGNKARTQDEGSSGLGLTIAKRLIELYGGTIEISSVPNQGSAARITLPLHQ